MIVDPLPCRTLVEQATDWLEGDMPTGERKEVELHLVTCAGCLAYMEQLRQTRQAMAQLGGRHWRQFFPALVNVLLRSQQPSGEWPPEPYGNDAMFGNAYTTAMAVLSLTPPLQLLPVYQR